MKGRGSHTLRIPLLVLYVILPAVVVVVAEGGSWQTARFATMAKTKNLTKLIFKILSAERFKHDKLLNRAINGKVVSVLAAFKWNNMGFNTSEEPYFA